MGTLPSTESARRVSLAPALESLPLVVFPQRGRPSSADVMGPVKACAARYLPRVGCILFRGFGSGQARDFARFAQAFDAHDDGDRCAPFAALHRETILIHAAGESVREPTQIACRRELARAVPGVVQARLLERGLCYERRFGGHGQPRWQLAFATDERAEVEAWCRAHDVRFQWCDRDGLRLLRQGPVVARDRTTHELLWSNEVLAFHERNRGLRDAREQLARNVYYADGSAIEASLVAQIDSAMRNAASVVHWEPGDVLVLDGALMAASGLTDLDPHALRLAPSLGRPLT